jgi:YggT family protein
MATAVSFLVGLINAYVFLIFLWVLGSWLPQWRAHDAFRVVERLVEPYINLFRGLNLHWGMMDLTPLTAMLFLSLFRALVLAAAGGRL